MTIIKHKLGSTFYLTKGQSSNIPLIALHGGPGGTCNGIKPILELSKDRPVYIYDQIGGGRSSPIEQKLWTIETFVEELHILLTKWKIKDFHLYGASWGTTLALEYYLRKNPKGLQSITFQSPMFSAKDWEDDANILIKKLPLQTQKVIKYCHEIGATDSKVYKEAVHEYYLRHVLQNETLLRKKHKKHAGNEIYEYMWGPSEFKATGTLKTYDQVKNLKKIKVPTLFLCGEHDEATPKTVKKYSKMIPNSKFRIIKNASHSVLRENKRVVLDELKKFLNT